MARTLKDIMQEQETVVSKIVESGMPRTFDRDIQVELLRGHYRVLEGLEIVQNTMLELAGADKPKSKRAEG